jgi:hypothetical protein
MTQLRDEGIILPIFPVPNEDGEKRGKSHYKVEHDLVVIVEGRNPHYEARYPANHLGKVQKTGQISIAAAFKPGTGSIDSWKGWRGRLETNEFVSVMKFLWIFPCIFFVLLTV